MEILNFDVEFTRDGALFDPAQSRALIDAAPSLTHLVVFSHGWNNDRADAAALYDGFVKSFGAIAKDRTIGLQERLTHTRLGVMRVFWPSKKFADADLIPGGGAAGSSTGAASVASRKALVDLLDRLQSSPERLGHESVDAKRRALVAKAKAQIDSLGSPAARKAFLMAVRRMLDPADAQREDGSTEFFSLDAAVLFRRLSAPVQFIGAASQGGAASLHDLHRHGQGGTATDGGASGLFGDAVDGALGAARRIVNYATYYQMKNRAGVVGSAGVAALVSQVRVAHADLPIIFIGHSFGGRVVASAAVQQPAHGKAMSMLLLQAAFSHNAFSADFDLKGHEGGFRAVVAAQKVAGPIVITHTKNDKAVGIAYPLASRFADQVASALGDENDPYGGLGRNGALFTAEAVAGDLLALGRPYAFRPGRIHNLRADAFIGSHGDVTGLQVAWAFAQLL